MEIIPTVIISILWIVLFGYWGKQAASSSRAARAEASLSRVIHLTLIGAAFALEFMDGLSIGILGQRFVPSTPFVVVSGLGITACGVAFAIWARHTLGQHWSGTVTIKAGHELIQIGPYALTRHPIYTGMLLAMFGTALTFGEWRGVIGVALMLIAYLRKIGLEEKWLSQEFGDSYRQYRAHVKALIPFVV